MGQSTVSRLAGFFLGAPEGLDALPAVQELSPGIIRILGQNPGPATLQGTNTYLVGKGAGRALVDTSDGNRHWWPLVQDILDSQNARITDVLLTHGHYDHVGGIAAVRASYPEARVWKWLVREAVEPPPDVPPEFERPQGRQMLKGQRQHGRSSQCCKSLSVTDCLDLSAGQEWLSSMRKEMTLEGATLQVLHTPGHTADSCCFSVEMDEETCSGLFTGDTVLGWSPTMFDDLASYEMSVTSLQRKVIAQPVILFPGHGATVPAERAVSYMKSILMGLLNRERMILRTLQESETSMSVDDLCSNLYNSSMAGFMAKKMVEQHLHSLVSKGQAEEVPGWFSTSTFQATERVAAATGSWP